MTIVTTIVKNHIKGIIVLLGAIMLLSCKNDVNAVYAIPLENDSPEMMATGMTLIYSDSARIKYKVKTPEYIKVTADKESYEEFPKGIDVTSYDDQGNVIGTIRSDWAKKYEHINTWEAKFNVVATNADGTKVETEHMFWDMDKKKIYSHVYTRITSGERIIEGNDGFESDQDLKNPVIKNITGIVEVER